VVRPLGRFTHTGARLDRGSGVISGAQNSTRPLSDGLARPLEELGGTLASLHCLICRVGGRACALPLEHVREVMRPCRIERIEPAPAYLLGVALIRGETVPVVDAGLLLTGEACAATRLVILRVGERRVALAVAEVVGTRALEEGELRALPPLLSGATELVTAMAVIDGKFVEVLANARLLELAAGPAVVCPADSNEAHA
jgi:purine-binding chemotaxis protein CheW